MLIVVKETKIKLVSCISKLSRSLAQLFLIVVILLPMNACCIYRSDVQQGNKLTQEMIREVDFGMSKRQVRRLLGPPMLIHLEDPDRWDYFYYVIPGDGCPPIEKRLSLCFRKDRLIKMEAIGYDLNVTP